MKIRADRRALAAAVKTAMRAQAPRLPVLNGIRLDATDDNRLAVTCTDIEVAITVSLAAEVVEPGVAIPPARLLAAFLAAGDETVEMVVDDNLATVTSGDASLRLHLLAVDDWPRLPEPPDTWTDLDAALVVDIGRVAISAGVDPSLPIYTGVKMDGSRVWATDSYRLGLVDDPELDLPDILVPARLAQAMVDLGAVSGGGDTDSDGVRMAATTNTVWFATADVEMSGRLLVGQFPKPDHVLRAKSAYHLDFDSAALDEALDRVKVVGADKNSNLVQFAVDQGSTLTLRRRSTEGNEITATVPCEGDFDGVIGFNLGYVQQAVNAAGTGTVRFEIEDGFKPVVLRSGRLTQVVMPIRVTGGGGA